MIFDKTKILKFEDYVEIKRPTYLYIKITPHKSTRNYNSNSIAKAIAGTYRAINKRIYKEQGKLIIESNFKISYVIDIENNNANFYFLVPKLFLNTILEKIKEVWSKATVEVMNDGIKAFGDNAQAYSLSYKKEDALSLKVDRKSNEPLNSILSVMEVMQESDRVTIIYNFIPNTQANWKEQYQSTMQKITEKKSIDKKIISFDYILRNGVLALLGVLEGLMNVIGDFVGGDTTGTQESLYTSIMGVLERQDELTVETKKKKEATVINAQILILSEGENTTQVTSNIINTCQAYSSIDADNELMYKKVKKVPKINDYDFKIDKNIFSAEEVGNFLQIPGRLLLNQFGIKHIKTEESKVPEELRTGTHRLGASKYKGTKIDAFLGKEYNIASLPLILFGEMGGGKTTFLTNYAKDSIKNEEGVIVIDFIKKCELSEKIKLVTPKEKLLEIDLSKQEELQGLGFDELKIPEHATAFEREELANLQTTQFKAFINSIIVGDPLSSRMETILGAACDISFSLGYTAIKDVIKCLTCYKTRTEYINAIRENKELADSFNEEIETLEELNEWSKPTAKEQKEGIKAEIVGTKDSKIEHILDRTRVLRSDTKLKHMYKKDTKNNIDLVKAMDDGKVVLIKMPQAKFPSKHVKNILVTYYMSKIWLALAQRGDKSEKPRRCNIIVDEIHQAPTVFNDLKDVITQTRKFGGKLVFALHHTKQLEQIEDTLESAGTSYMLLTGSLESDFNHFKSKIPEFEYEDLRDMEEYSSLNIIKYSKGYSSFITKLPGPI